MTFASLKHGNAKSPISGRGGISMDAMISEISTPSTYFDISSAIFSFMILILYNYSSGNENLTFVPLTISPSILNVPLRR